MIEKPRLSGSEIFHITLKDALVSAGILAAACFLCLFLRSVTADGEYCSMVFILAVFLIARFTDGFFCGVLSSFVAVLAVNYLFTYPYFHFNFTLAGYPLTILCMLAVSVITSTLTSRAKREERVRVEVEKEKTRSNLLRAVSHDLRTPLTSISGAISVILETGDALPAAQRDDLLRNAQSDAQWLIRMVENLLTVTRIDGDGEAGIQKEPEAVEDIVSGAVRKFRTRFPDVALDVRIPTTCLMVPVDAELIEQVLLNLFENAVFHGKRVRSIVLTVSEVDGKARFCVRDDGAGIESARLAHLFDGRILGSDESMGDRRRNMGIGLSVCSAIIKAHGGEITAHNAPGGGAQFDFLLDL